jgi:hypothetical protein
MAPELKKSVEEVEQETLELVLKLPNKSKVNQ